MAIRHRKSMPARSRRSTHCRQKSAVRFSSQKEQNEQKLKTYQLSSLAFQAMVTQIDILKKSLEQIKSCETKEACNFEQKQKL